jgi:hypothetical protein
MTEYKSQEMDYIHQGSLLYVLHKIGPIWAIEYPQLDRSALWGYFDEEGVKVEWEKLKNTKRK